ncbi:hypothetical protein PVAND_011859 [Polypedilum vanderplanki]|uniref:Pentraxin (PTX) domain-containing protein n=1 Tax=Polypedilum vanderplanki TaxID=319348 RepID=A0A9J6CLN6_POLVA|nr:hypothetical protein PVAND_011859 [Polypedilum vanderplanki]
MKKILIQFISILPLINCWKPLTSHPSSFSVHQTYPAIGSELDIARKSANEIVYNSNGDTIADSSIVDSFHKNDFHDESVSALRINDGRFLSAKALLFDSFNNFNGIFHEDTCAFNKFAIDHDSTINYDTSRFKKLEQFTLCLWMRFTKHDGDHVLFTYSVHDEPREIQFWVSNVNSSSFMSLAVRGYSLYRLNYPLAMKKWHHTCTSWNGKTGEWQLWVKSERVGRGFYNRLVSHEIEAGGKAFSGGQSTTGKTVEGLHMELISLQLYSVALSAGKAHRDHKHHHVHKFDHNGEISTTTTTPRPSIVPNQAINPLLANGQFPSRVKINLAGVQSTPPPATINTNFVRGQFHLGARNLQQQLLSGNALSQLQSQSQFNGQSTSSIPQLPAFSSSPQTPAPTPSSIQFSQNDGSFSFTSSYNTFGRNPADVEIIDESELPTIRFKRQTASENDGKTKRDLLTLTDGSLIDDKFFDTDWYDGLAQFGGNDLKNALTKQDNLEDEIREHDREPAEGEVEAVRSYCNSCLVEPFESALAITWKGAQPGFKVLKAKASKVCGDF